MRTRGYKHRPPVEHPYNLRTTSHIILISASSNPKPVVAMSCSHDGADDLKATLATIVQKLTIWDTIKGTMADLHP